MRKVPLFEWRGLVILGITPKLVIFVMSRNAGGPLGTRNTFSDGLGMEIICWIMYFKVRAALSLTEGQELQSQNLSCSADIVLQSLYRKYKVAITLRYATLSPSSTFPYSSSKTYQAKHSP